MDVESVENKIGVVFRNKELLKLAFVHRSFWNEHRAEIPDHNERIEFLGDSVLGLVVAEYLYLHYPQMPEGELSDIRSQLVEAASCVLYVQKLNIAPNLCLGRGEKMNTGKGRETILADLFEALIGAIYLDGGYEGARTFFFNHFQEEVDQIVASPMRNWKTELQDIAQRRYQQIPVYEVLEESGPAHRKMFRVAVFVAGKRIGEGEGRSKREAQAKAAEQGVLQLEKGE